jgi:histidine triad (HIT) family protein
VTVSDCIFCEIIRGERPAHVVLSTEETLAFLDHSPLFHGHVLVVPRAHHVTLWETPPELLASVLATVRRIAPAVVAGMKADGAFVANNNVISQSVPHLHFHVIPRRKGDGLKGFFWPRHKYKDEGEAVAAREAIKAALTT